MAVTFKPESLVIELPTGTTPKYESLFDFQTNIIDLLQHRDMTTDNGYMDV